MDFLRTIRRTIGLPEHVRFSASLLASPEFLERLTIEHPDDQVILDVLDWGRTQTDKCRDFKGQLTFANLEMLLRDPARQAPVKWERESPPPAYLIRDDRPRITWILNVEYFRDMFNVSFTS
jgi:hypothetical protein